MISKDTALECLTWSAVRQRQDESECVKKKKKIFHTPDREADSSLLKPNLCVCGENSLKNVSYF